MKRSTQFMLCSSMLLTLYAFACWFFSLSIVQHGCQEMALAPLVPLVMIIVFHGINHTLMGRGISMPVYIVIVIAMTAALAVAFFRSTFIAENGIGSRITASAICAFSALCSAYIAAEAPKKVSLTTCFDFDIIMLAILLGLNYAIGIPITATVVIVLVIAAVATLITLIKSRIDSESVSGAAQGDPIGGKIMIVAVFIVVAILVALIVVVAKGGIHSFSELCLSLFHMILNGIKSLASLIYRGLEAIMLWISQFFSDEVLPMEPTGSAVGMAAPQDEVMDVRGLPSWFGYAVLGAIVAVIAFILFRLRGQKMDARVRVVRKSTNKGKRTNGFGAYMRRLLRRIKEKLLYTVNTVRYRNTAPGLLAWCMKHAGRKVPRNAGESGEKYILRLASVAVGDSAEALTELSKLIEKSFYSPGPVNVPRSVCSAVRKARFEIN